MRTPPSPHGYAGSTTHLQRYTIIRDGKEVQLDLVCSDYSDPYGDTLDINVNALGITHKNEVFLAAKFCSTTLDQTLEHIRDKAFIQINPLNDARFEKTKKLMDRGWQNRCIPYDATHLPAVGDKVWAKTYSTGNFTLKGEIIETSGSIVRVRTTAGERWYPIADVLGKVAPSNLSDLKRKEGSQPGPTETKKDEGNMSEQKSWFQTEKEDVIDGAYRASAKRIPKTARMALIAYLKHKKVKAGWIKSLKEFMETEWGQAAVQKAMSVIFRELPMLKDDPRALALAKEWSVDAYATVSDQLLNEVMTFFGPIVSQVMDLPMPEKVRVSVKEESNSDSSADSEKEAEAEAEAQKGSRLVA